MALEEKVMEQAFHKKVLLNKEKLSVVTNVILLPYDHKLQDEILNKIANNFSNKLEQLCGVKLNIIIDTRWLNNEKIHSGKTNDGSSGPVRLWRSGHGNFLPRPRNLPAYKSQVWRVCDE